MTEDTIKTKHQALAKIVIVNLDDLAIPTHALLRILIAHRLIAMRVTGLFCIRQRCHPVVRYLRLLPGRIIKFLHIRSFVMYRAGLCQIVEILCTTAEILLRIGCMSYGKLPFLVKTDGFTNTLSLGSENLHQKCEQHE